MTKKKKGNNGKKFEESIRDAAEQLGIFYLRLQDSMKFMGKDAKSRFTPKSPYDGLLYLGEELYCLELKSTEGTSLSVGEKSMIKTHQITELTKSAQFKGVNAGFLILFHERTTKTSHREETLFYVPIERFNQIFHGHDRKSFSFEDCLLAGYQLEKVNVATRKFRWNLNDLKTCR